MRGSISVCIPAYRSQFLAATIESILSQTRPVAEIIVMDDFSPENLHSVVEPYISAGVKYVRNSQNVGVPNNYNRVLSVARSDYVMLFGDHDIMESRFIELYAGPLDECPEVGLVFSAEKAIDEAGQVLQVYRYDFPRIFPGQLLARHLVTNVAAPLTLDTLIRRSALEQEDIWFDPNYWWYPDIDLWIRLASKWCVGYISEPVLLRRIRERAHYLNDKAWESFLVCDRIRRNNWQLAFSNDSWTSVWGKLKYAYQCDKKGLILTASQRMRNSVSPPKEAHVLFTPLGYILARLILLFPRRFLQAIRSLYS